MSYNILEASVAVSSVAFTKLSFKRFLNQVLNSAPFEADNLSSCPKETFSQRYSFIPFAKPLKSACAPVIPLSSASLTPEAAADKPRRIDAASTATLPLPNNLPAVRLSIPDITVLYKKS